MIQKDVELGSRGFTFADKITHKQVLLVDLLERVNLDVAIDLAPAWISPLLKEEEKRRVMLSLLENALDTIEMIKIAQKHIGAIRSHIDFETMNDYLKKIVDFSFIGFDNPDAWEYADPSITDESNDGEDEQMELSSHSNGHSLFRLQRVKPKVFYVLHKLFKVKFSSEAPTETPPENEAVVEASQNSLEQMLQRAKLVDDISVPLVWLQYNLEQFNSGMTGLKRQIQAQRERMVVLFNKLSSEQYSELFEFLGADHLQASHAKNVLRREPSDLFIQ